MASNRGNDAANKAADKLRPITKADRTLSAQLAERRASESVGHRTEQPHHPDGWQIGGRSEGYGSHHRTDGPVADAISDRPGHARVAQ